jgi:hypothetical protein
MKSRRISQARIAANESFLRERRSARHDIAGRRHFGAAH